MWRYLRCGSNCKPLGTHLLDCKWTYKAWFSVGLKKNWRIFSLIIKKKKKKKGWKIQ